MDRLPVEILNRIFSKLHYSQKVRCALVCSQWATHIHSFNLHNDLTIEDTITSSDRFFYAGSDESRRKMPTFDAWEKRITQEPRWGKQVRQLLLIHCLYKDENFTALPTLFPFIRTLLLQQDREFQPSYEAIETAQFEPWLYRLEKLVETYTHMFTYTLLGAGIFERLESITIAYDKTMIASASDLFERFQHVPYLKNLALDRFEFSFQLLETLHKHAPKLVSLNIGTSSFTSTGDLPPGIEPFPSLTTLKINSCDFPLRRLEPWAQYFIAKYPNVTELAFDTGDIHEYYTSDEDQMSTSVLGPMFQLLASRLEFLCILHYGFKPEWLAILQQEGSKLHRLHMSAHFKPQTIQNLVPYSLFQNLSVLSIEFVCTTDFTWLESLTHLKQLKMDYMLPGGEEKENSVLLNQLLFFAPATLDKLRITRAHVTVGTPAIMTNSNIKCLKIKHGAVDDLAIAFIAEYCRQIHTLSFVYNDRPFVTEHRRQIHTLSFVHNDGEVLVINLPNHHLTYFEITTPNNRTNVKVTTNTCTRLFLPNHKFTRVKRSMLKDTVRLTCFSTQKSNASAIVEKDDESKQTIHLTCQSLQNLFINEHCAY
jgi:hypothetical protein